MDDQLHGFIQAVLVLLSLILGALVGIGAEPPTSGDFAAIASVAAVVAWILANVIVGVANTAADYRSSSTETTG